MRQLEELRQYADNFFILQESGKLKDIDRDALESLLRTTHFHLRNLLDHLETIRPTLSKKAVADYIQKAIEYYEDGK